MQLQIYRLQVHDTARRSPPPWLAGSQLRSCTERVHAHPGSVVLGMCQGASSAVAADTSPHARAALFKPAGLRMSSCNSIQFPKLVFAISEVIPTLKVTEAIASHCFPLLRIASHCLPVVMSSPKVTDAIASHGFPWLPIASHCFPLLPIGFYVFLVIFPCGPMKNHGSYAFLAIFACGPMKNH